MQNPKKDLKLMEWETLKDKYDVGQQKAER